MLERENAEHIALHVEQRAAAVAFLDGNRDLQHVVAVNVARGGEHALHDAEAKTFGSSHRHHILALADFGGIAQWQWLEVFGVNFEQSEVALRVRGVDGSHRMRLAIVHLDLQSPCLTDDMQVRGNEAVRADDEAGTDAIRALTAKLSDFDQRRSDGLREIGGGLRLWRRRLGLRGEQA